ncbi:hypothetical protein DU74_02210 [Methanosarcina mazei]|uniref:Uncharacterized protein n=1 Tax=Methanosarcina mazei TaxID=2209 RepID=A0A0F8Q118_METMZ|nr:flippase [Methanosarcina mazei]KKH59370.1 hypothetical protein DU74_02210 [Methanosarcina mazei]
MNTYKTIFKNTLATALSQVITSILGFLLLIYIARYLGETEFGKYSFAVSFTLLFIIFQDLGISNFIVIEIARRKEIASDYLTNALEIKTISSVLVFGLIYLTINIMDYPPETRHIVYLFGIYTILTYFAQTFKSVFQAFEKMEYVAFITTSEKTILFLLAIYVLTSGFGLIELAYVHILTGAFSILLSYYICFKKIEKPKITTNLVLWKKLIVESIPFGLNTLFGMMFFKIDTVMLSVFQNDADVGIYNAAYIPLLSLVGIISTMAISSLYPVMSRYFIDSEESLTKITILSSKYMAIIGFPICIGCFTLAKQFIELFYVNQYSDSVIAFRIISLYIPLRLVSSITGTHLTSINKQRLRTLSVALGSLFNIILNLILIPSLSYVGASIATVLSEVFLYFLFIHYINRNYKKLELHNYYLKPLIASLLMGGLVYYLKDMNLFLLILLAIIVYFGILLVLRAFDHEDMNIVNQLVRRS